MCSEIHESNIHNWLNKKYRPLPGEFVYKNVPHCIWSKLDFIKRVENDDIFYPDDLLIATYPKSGTTVLEEMIWLISNNVDIHTAKKFNIICRFPFIDENYEHNYPNLNYNGYIIDAMDMIPRPRYLKTHLLYRNLEYQMSRNPEMKVITCLRNPRDTAVSMYHFYKGVPDYGPYQGTWDEFFERWYDGWIAAGDWLDVATEWWGQRNRNNVKLVFFEDIITNKRKVIDELCVFLNKTLSDEDKEKIIQHSEFKNMKNNPATNYENVEGFEKGFVFMRKGQVGDWKNYFNEEQIKRLDDKYEPVLKQIGLNFRYE